ncbi:hypothetical protein ACT9XH_02900 [Methanococcoides methylutens]|uniref:hypothetical protein n=1 Tax=Methanococcoides methylutens TaxID=2226 RepID=UPI0040442D9E
MNRFSKKYKTFEDWLKSKPRTSKYARRIIDLHERFPHLTLGKIRELRQHDYDVSIVPWTELSPKDKRERVLALRVLNSIRKGNSLTHTLDETGASRDIVMRHLGRHLIKDAGRWKARTVDKIQIEMTINTKAEGRVSIITTNSQDRSLIGQYFALVQKALNNNDPTVLDKFKNRTIVDAEGKVHKLETDLSRLYEIEEAMEEPEFFEIYKY